MNNFDRIITHYSPIYYKNKRRKNERINNQINNVYTSQRIKFVNTLTES